MTAPVVVADGLGKRYGTVVVLDGLGSEVAGTVVGLLAPNGSGKTTTVAILSTALRPDQGTATLCGLAHQAHASHPD